MKHLSIPHIHPHMTHRAGGCIGPGEKDQVTRPCLLTGHDGALIIDSFRCCPGQVVDAGLCVDPADIPAAVKAISELTRGKTIITIAHRLATIENADQILVIDGGTAAQKGTHKELLEQEGTYREFVRIREQAEGWQIQ